MIFLYLKAIISSYIFNFIYLGGSGCCLHNYYEKSNVKDKELIELPVIAMTL